MTDEGRLSTCGICGGTVEYAPRRDLGYCWKHNTPPRFAHMPDPDDGYVSGPDDDEEELCSPTSPGSN